tara:strand:- start:48 stop:275 length:228 start_codon:yes stop_codon:yes gene_type:complete
LIIDKLTVNDKTRNCPKCGSDKVIPIVYGEMVDSPKVIQQVEDGEFDPGGCCADNDSPKWKYRECEERFGKIDWA